MRLAAFLPVTVLALLLEQTHGHAQTHAPAAAPGRSSALSPAPGASSPRPPAAQREDPSPTLSAPAMPPGPLSAVPVIPRAAPRAQLAIAEFTLTGENTSPALAMQLQDGLLVGLLRSGVPALDSGDVAQRIAERPELGLGHCDSSPCLKELGHLLDVKYVLRIKVDVTGNSYKLISRLFTTEGTAPAALPVDTQTRFCDVCTIDEARAAMIRLADAVKKPLEEHVPLPLPVLPPPPRPSLRAPGWGLAVGILALAAGAGWLLAGSGSRTAAGFAGALIGAGAATTAVSGYWLEEKRSAPALVGGKF